MFIAEQQNGLQSELANVAKRYLSQQTNQDEQNVRVRRQIGRANVAYALSKLVERIERRTMSCVYEGHCHQAQPNQQQNTALRQNRSAVYRMADRVQQTNDGSRNSSDVKTVSGETVDKPDDVMSIMKLHQPSVRLSPKARDRRIGTTQGLCIERQTKSGRRANAA